MAVTRTHTPVVAHTLRPPPQTSTARGAHRGVAPQQEPPLAAADTFASNAAGDVPYVPQQPHHAARVDSAVPVAIATGPQDAPSNAPAPVLPPIAGPAPRPLAPALSLSSHLSGPAALVPHPPCILHLVRRLWVSLHVHRNESSLDRNYKKGKTNCRKNLPCADLLFSPRCLIVVL